MANVDLSLSQTSGFIPDIWAGRALEVLRNNIVIAKLCNTDYNATEYANVGHTLNIPYPGTFSAQDKAADTLVSVQQPVGGKTVQVTLSKHKYVDFLVEDIAAAQASQSLLDRYVKPAAIALAEQLETDLIALQSGLTLPTIGTAGTDATSSLLRQAEYRLNIGKVPRTDRYAVFSPKDETALLGAADLATYFAFAKPEAITEGALARIYGLDVFTSQMLAPDVGTNMQQTVTVTGTPTGGTFTLTFNGQTTAPIAYNATAATVQAALLALSTIGSSAQGNGVAVTGGPGPGTAWVVTFTGEFAGQTVAALTHTDAFTGGSSPAAAVTTTQTSATKNLVFHQDAFILATRPFHPPPAGSGVLATTMTDDTSGLVIRVLYQYDINYRAVHLGFDMLYGMANLRPEVGLVALT